MMMMMMIYTHTFMQFIRYTSLEIINITDGDGWLKLKKIFFNGKSFFYFLYWHQFLHDITHVYDLSIIFLIIIIIYCKYIQNEIIF